MCFPGNAFALAENSTSRTTPSGRVNSYCPFTEPSSEQRAPGLLDVPLQPAQRSELQAEQLVARATDELAGGRVDIDVGAFVVRDDHRLEGSVEDGLEQVRAFLALGDVDEEALLVERRALGVVQRVHLIEHPADGAVRADDPVLELERLASIARQLLATVDELEVIRVQGRIPELCVVEPQLDRVAEELLDLRAHIGRPRLHVRHEGVHVRDERQLFDQAPVLLLLALELLLARHIGEVTVDVELAVIGAMDDADVAYPHLATGSCRDPVFDRHLPVLLAQLGEGGEEARKILGAMRRSQKSAASKSSVVKPNTGSI